MRHNPDHDYNDPAGAAKAARALVYVKQMPPCSTCNVVRTVVPGPGTAWDIETGHEPHCPQHEDNAEGVEVHLLDMYDGQDRVTAEALWQLEAHDPGDGAA